jgi:hypothetical protein
MSTCSASDPARTPPIAARLVALALLLAGTVSDPAAAKSRVEHIAGEVVTVETEAGEDTADVHIRVRHPAGGMIVVDEGVGDMVRVFDDAYVGPDEHVEGDVVAVFGSVEVHGKVDGNVVSVMGSVVLGPQAEVGQDLVSVGGAIERADSAVVQGQTVSVGFMPMFGMPALPMMITFVFAGWLVAIFMGWLFSTLLPTRFMRVAATASRRAGASFLVGLISMPAAMVAMVLLLVTVIGIPLALLLPLIHGLIAFGGQLAAIYLLGLRITGRRFGSHPILPIVAGATLVAGFFVVSAMLFTVPGLARPAGLFFSLLGTLLLAGLTAIGCGAFILSRLGSQPRDVIWAPADPIPAPPMPPVGGTAAGGPHVANPPAG